MVYKLIYKSETDAFKVKLTTDIKYYLISTFLRFRKFIYQKKKRYASKNKFSGDIVCIKEIGSKSYYQGNLGIENNI